MKKRIVILLSVILLFLSLDRIIGYTLNIGLEKYFGLNTPAKVLLIGHSHLMLATDKAGMETHLGVPVAKYCREGVNVADRYQMVKHYLDTKYADSLKVVLYGVDQFMFTDAGLSANSYKLFYPFMDDKIMDNYIRKEALPLDYWQHKLICTTRYSDALLNSAIRGWMSNWDNYKYGQLDVQQLKYDLSVGKQRHICFERQLVDLFERTLNLLTGKGVRVVLVNTPIAQLLNEYEPEKYRKVIDYFKELDERSKLIYYLDFNPQYEDQYDMFFDPIHINPTGQKKISGDINSFLLKNKICDL